MQKSLVTSCKNLHPDECSLRAGEAAQFTSAHCPQKSSLSRIYEEATFEEGPLRGGSAPRSAQTARNTHPTPRSRIIWTPQGHILSAVCWCTHGAWSRVQPLLQRNFREPGWAPDRKRTCKQQQREREGFDAIGHLVFGSLVVVLLSS